MSEVPACKAACVVIYDPWYPAIPNGSPARSQWLSGCPALVLGSVAFNTKSEKGTIAAEGQEVGLQVCAHLLAGPRATTCELQQQVFTARVHACYQSTVVSHAVPS